MSEYRCPRCGSGNLEYYVEGPPGAECRACRIGYRDERAFEVGKVQHTEQRKRWQSWTLEKRRAGERERLEEFIGG